MQHSRGNCSGPWLAALFVALAWGVPASARPEYLSLAQKYGASDCAFCHALASGGEARNERGTWLVLERERRGTDRIEIDWLAARDPLVARTKPAPTGRVPEVVSLPRVEPASADASRPFDHSTAHGDWPAYAGDLQARKYSPLDQIEPGNLARLQIAWIWQAKERRGFFERNLGIKVPDSFKATPLMAGGRLFVRSRYSEVLALDPLSGEELWYFDPGTRKGQRPPMFGFSTRGLAYHRDAQGARILLLTTDGWLMALSPETGEPIRTFGRDGRVDLTVGLRRPLPRSASTWSYPPALCGDTVVVGNQPSDGSHQENGERWKENVPLGDVRGFDVHSGEQVWVFRTVPQAGEFGNETWGDDSWRWMGNTNVWSMMSCDPDLGIIYLPVTAPTHHFYGGSRPGDNLFATSLVAVDAKTGRRVWHFQTVRHDIWDYDLPAAPVVADLVVEGRPVKAVAQVGKTGFVYVFDRETGKPVWPIEERPVPASTLAGERASPTQPFPTRPPPFELQGTRREDLLDFTPELRLQAVKVLEGKRLGPLFEPPSTEGTLMTPGIGGGANWGGAAFDPESRTFYVASRRLPTLLQARKVDRARFGFDYLVDASFPFVEGLPPVKPPWSSVTAYALDRGEVAWKVANGPGPRGHPRLSSLDLPDLGDIGAAPGLLVTKRLLFLGGNRENGQAELRALDKDSGALLWRHPVAGTHEIAAPMTYQAGGRQFVVIASGSYGEPARLTAFRLP